MTACDRGLLQRLTCRRAVAVLVSAVWPMAIAAAQVAPVPGVVLPAGWVPLTSHSDEFSDEEPDPLRWQTDVPAWGSWTWDPGLVEVGGGKLRLGMVHAEHERDGRRLFYKGGIVRSNGPPLTYGYFEARIKAAPRWPGVATAFWLFRNTPEYWTEIDIVEMMQRRLTRSTIDYSLYVMRGTSAESLPVRQKYSWQARWDPSDDFHVYGCLWTADAVSFYVDGILLSTRQNRFWHRPMDVVLSVGLRKPLTESPEADGFPTWVEVDYLRVWGVPSR